VVEVATLPGATSSRYHADRPLLWAEATDLGGGACWLPFEVVHTSALLPAPTGSGCFSSTSNGLASGNHRLEALCHALCEVIERDAAAVWQARLASERAATRVNLADVGDDACREVLDRYRFADIEVRAWETTSDTGVPAYLCEILDTRSSSPGLVAFTGMGCHLAAPIALLRALTEAAQSRMTYITGSRDDLFRRDYRAVRQDALRGAEHAAGQPGRTLADAPSAPPTTSFEEDARILRQRLVAAGLGAVLVVDLTSERFGLPVLRVVVPGLEGPDDEPSYVPGQRARAAAIGRTLR
jgi:ribosomal protein S12 methylthiotransferase accessory factor